jgi:hypothetical protein
LGKTLWLWTWSRTCYPCSASSLLWKCAFC